MTGLVLARSGLAAALLTAALAAPAVAQGSLQLAQADGDALMGTWYRADRPGGVRLEADGVVNFNGDAEWPQTAATCTAGFEHTLRTVDSAVLYAELTQDDFYSNEDVPIATGLEGRLPDGMLTVLDTYCYGASEIGGAVNYVLVAPSRLLAVAFGDGVYAIEDLQREPPLVPPQVLDQETREAIQRALQARGFYADEIDGMFGPGTRAAISAYQASLAGEQTGILNRHQLDILLGD